MKKIIELNEDNFGTEVVRSPAPVLVDFYASWCGPCKMLAPVLDALAAEFDGDIKFAKVNVDEAPELAGCHGITGVPTLLLFRDGQVVDSVVGMMPPKALRAWLKEKTSAPLVPADPPAVSA